MNNSLFDIKNTIAFLNRHKIFKKTIIFCDVFTTKLVTYGFYALLAHLLISLDKRVLPVALIPLFTFGITIFIRNKLNYPRPFQTLGFTPLVSHAKGNSCPSGHASSSAAISMAFYYIYPPAGFFFIAVTIIICVTRVLAGVHYPKDVILGALMGLCFGSGFLFL